MPKRFMALNARWMKDAEDFVQIVAASILHTGRARMPRFGLMKLSLVTGFAP